MSFLTDGTNSVSLTPSFMSLNYTKLLSPLQECVEEICNYEEAREVFESNVQGLTTWWENEHPSNQSQKDSNTGIIVGVVIIITCIVIIIGIIIYTRQ